MLEDLSCPSIDKDPDHQLETNYLSFAAAQESYLSYLSVYHVRIYLHNCNKHRQNEEYNRHLSVRVFVICLRELCHNYYHIHTIILMRELSLRPYEAKFLRNRLIHQLSDHHASPQEVESFYTSSRFSPVLSSIPIRSDACQYSPLALL